MDYDLSRLSWRSFEQLVQALAVRHFGPGVVVFGDGPDGGREATFRGATPYAPHGKAWDGVGVVQAKFRQRPLGTEHDGPWALGALQQELAKMKALGENRPQADYYVFATNVVLSPRRGGMKDQVLTALAEAGPKLGLREFDIWDYDKLRTWIDVDEEVRTRFGWITAGDVLAAMLKSISGATPDFEKAIVNYLEKTLVTDRFVHLEEAGHSSDEQTALSQVFVDLPVVDDGAGDALFMRRLLERTAMLRVDPAVDDSEEREQRLILVGGPGQGKTTLGQFACQVLRASLLAERPRARLSPEGREAIEAVKSACESSDLPFGRGPRFPVRVVLTDLARALTDQEQPLLTYLAKMIAERVGSDVSTDLFRAWLGAYPWFVVLDGLDEVPTNAGRERVMRCISDFWVDAAQVDADIVVLATTRPQGYNNDFSPQRHEHIVLAELAPDRALHYGSRLAEARYGRDSERTATVTARLGEATEDPTTVHLMRSPLQVAIMTALVDRYGRPPQERWGLFAAYYDVIYQRERERDTGAARILREYRPDIDAIHERVGLTLQVLTTHGSHADPRLTTEQLERVIDARLEVEGHTGPGSAAMVTDIRAAAELRLVFLVGAESDRIGFEIRSLQEFMAAGALVDGRDDEVIRRLSAIAPLPSWRNVLLFAAGQCFVRKQHLRAELHDLCRALDVDKDELLFSAWKMGARLALDLLQDRTARKQPKHHRVIAQHALELLQIPHGNIASTLATCHDQDVDDLYRAALAAAVRSADQVERTNARRCLLLISKDGTEWAMPLLREHLPTTAADAVLMLDEMSTQTLEPLGQADLLRCIALLRHRDLNRLRPAVSLAGLPTLESGQVEVEVDILPGLQLRLVSIRNSARTSQPEWAVEQSRCGSSPTLVVHQAAWRFWRTPTSEGLAEAAQLVARDSTPDVWAECATDVPWPLGVLLARAQSHESLLQAADEAREGVYGDHMDWAAAEETWANDFRSLREAMTAPIAFPIEVAGARITPSQVSKELPWLDDFRTLDPLHPVQRTQLASLMLWFLGFGPTGGEVSAEVSDVVDVARAMESGIVYLNLGVLAAGWDDADRLAALMEGLPEDTRFHSHDGPRDDLTSRRLQALADCAASQPSARSYQALAAALASTHAGLPDLAALPDVDTTVARAAAAFIRFITGASERSARELGRIFGECSGTSIGLLNSPVVQGAVNWPAFLSGVHDTAPKTWHVRRQIDQLIAEVVSRHSTPLADVATWNALGLFDPHPLALT